MSDRHMGYIVTLENNIKDENAQSILDAIGMVKGVISVRPVVSDFVGHMAEERARRKLADKLWKALESPTTDGSN